MANTLPFITDQMIGASGTELSATVDWIEALSLAIPAIIGYYTGESIVSVFLYSTGIALYLSSIIVRQHWLVTEPQITNLIKHVALVLNFARTNKYAKNRSALIL